jgi:hypothetical protein
MAKKPTLTTVSSGYQSTTQLNANLNAINNALDNTLSLDGSTPNAMTADIDLNSNDLLNVATTRTTNLYLGGTRVVAEGTLNTVSNMDVDEFTGNGSTVAYVLSSTPLTVDVVLVNVDGVAQLATSYTLSVATLTFSEAPPLNSAIQIRYFTDIALGATTSADLVSYSQGSTGHVTRTVEARLRDHVSVLDFGAVGDGVANDTAAIQAAITAVGAAGGGEVKFPAGAFLITAPLLVSNPRVRITGTGRRSTRIMQATASSVTFNITNEYFTANNFSVEYVTQGTAGGTAFQTSFFYGTWNDIYIRNANVGWHFLSGSNSQLISNVVAEDSTQNGFLISGDNVKIINFFVLNQLSASFCQLGGLRMLNKAEGCVITDGQLYGGKFAMTTDAAVYAVGSRPAYNKFNSVFFDSAIDGVSLERVVEFDFLNCWFSNRPTNGCRIVSGDGIRFIGGGAINSAKHGVLVEAAATNVLFDGFAARGNGTEAANTYDGIIFAVDAADFTVVNCTLGGAAALSFGTQRYGLHISAGASDNYVVTGNIVTGNGTAGMLEGGSGTAKRVAGNIGFSTASAGPATVLIGTSSTVVTHGLAATPGQSDIQITPVSDVAERWWVSAASATTFTISLSGAAAADRFFSWATRVKGA